MHVKVTEIHLHLQNRQFWLPKGYFCICSYSKFFIDIVHITLSMKYYIFYIDIMSIANIYIFELSYLLVKKKWSTVTSYLENLYPNIMFFFLF